MHKIFCVGCDDAVLLVRDDQNGIKEIWRRVEGVDACHLVREDFGVADCQSASGFVVGLHLLLTICLVSAQRRSDGYVI